MSQQLRGFATAIWLLCAMWLITLTGAEVVHWTWHHSAALGHARNPVMVRRGRIPTPGRPATPISEE